MKQCPYHKGSRPTFINRLRVKDAKIVMEVCDCGQVLWKQRIRIAHNPDSFIKGESSGC